MEWIYLFLLGLPLDCLSVSAPSLSLCVCFYVRFIYFMLGHSPLFPFFLLQCKYLSLIFIKRNCVCIARTLEQHNSITHPSLMLLFSLFLEHPFSSDLFAFNLFIKCENLFSNSFLATLLFVYFLIRIRQSMRIQWQCGKNNKTIVAMACSYWINLLYNQLALCAHRNHETMRASSVFHRFEN